MNNFSVAETVTLFLYAKTFAGVSINPERMSLSVKGEYMAEEVNTQGTQEGTEQNGNGTARQPEKKYTEKAVAKLLKELGNNRQGQSKGNSRKDG